MRKLPTITKNLLLINIIVWLIDSILKSRGIYLTGILGLQNWSVTGFSLFSIWQPFTYMFTHAGFDHIFFNMFAVLMFAPALEYQWGSRRFLIYYLLCGIGAALTQEFVWYLAMPGIPSVTIGASGAVFGILFAFGWLFPNTPMFLLFIPVPIRARVFVMVYAVVELFLGLSGSMDNVAHFAHLGGLIFGWIIILIWRFVGSSGFEKQELGDSPLTRWIRNKWHNFTHRDKDDDDDEQYRHFHYHSSTRN